MFSFYFNKKTVFLIHQEYVPVQSVNLVWIWSPILKSKRRWRSAKCQLSCEKCFKSYFDVRYAVNQKISAAHMLLVTGFKSDDLFFVMRTFWCASPILSFSAFNNLIFLPQYKCHEEYRMLIFKDQTGRKRWAAELSGLDSWNFSFKTFIFTNKSLSWRHAWLLFSKSEAPDFRII